MNAITIKEVKDFLSIGDFEKDKYLQEVIPVAVEFVRDFCENPDLEIKGGAKIATMKIIEFYMDSNNLQSKSVSRVSETFLTEIPQSILQLLSPYKKNVVKFL